VLVTWPGTFTSCRLASVMSTAAQFFWTTDSPRFAVSLLDGLLDGVNGLIARKNAADREEAGLHDRVDTAAHARFLRHGDGVDREELQMFLDNLLFA